MPDIDFGRISESLNEKSDRDLRNVDTAAKADAVIDYQEPTSANNWTWYRKYKSGWVEQGGVLQVETSGWKSARTFSLPIKMANIKYNVNWTSGYSDTISEEVTVTARTTTSFTISKYTNYQSEACWEVKGMAAN